MLRFNCYSLYSSSVWALAAPGLPASVTLPLFFGNSPKASICILVFTKLATAFCTRMLGCRIEPHFWKSQGISWSTLLCHHGSKTALSQLGHCISAVNLYSCSTMLFLTTKEQPWTSRWVSVNVLVSRGKNKPKDVADPADVYQLQTLV